VSLPLELRDEVAGRLPGREVEELPPQSLDHGLRATARAVLDRTPRLRAVVARVPRSRQDAVQRGRRVAKRAALAAYRRSAAVDGRLDELRDRLDKLVARQTESVVAASRTEANRVNIELLKAEVRALEASLRELGMAFAPATGLAGAGKRFAEQREQTNAIERRVRLLDRTVRELRNGIGAASEEAPSPVADAAPPAPSGPASALFDYVSFERRFRGDPEEVLHTQTERYVDLLLDGLPRGRPVVDIGCGRGELLAELQRRGATVLGVDTDPGMVAEAGERGIPVQQKDAVRFLREAEPGSLGAIFSAHVAEHLQLDDLLELISLSVSRLRPGGMFVAETPNPAALIVLGNSYVLDPTHVRPLHPSLFSFLCESAGFRDVGLRYYSPAEGYHLPLVSDGEVGPGTAVVNEAFRKLNHVLFGPQDYAVMARTADAEAVPIDWTGGS
jgi:SAM-dependent methyltransferase